MNHYQAIIEALKSLDGEGTIQEVDQWIDLNFPEKWKDTGTSMADMVPKTHGGNQSTLATKEYQVLERIGRGKYRIFK